jgi:hypothetical protein
MSTKIGLFEKRASTSLKSVSRRDAFKSLLSFLHGVYTGMASPQVPSYA